MKHTKAEIEEQTTRLKAWLPKGSTVFTILESVSKSGMSRQIRLVAFGRDDSGKITLDDNGEPYLIHPNYGASVILGWTQAKPRSGDGIKVGGCGMDMGFHLVYSLSCALHGDGYALNHRWL